MSTHQIQIISTGVPGLDTILGGGIPVGSLIMVVGAPGTGKTILLQQMCFTWVRQAPAAPPAADSADAATGPPPLRRAVYFSTLSEPHDKLLDHIRQFSFFTPDLLGTQVKVFSLVATMEQGLAAVASEIINTVRSERAGLVCIDSFAALASMTPDSDALRRFLYRLSSQLLMLGATVFVSLERTLGASSGNTVTEADLAVADGILGLYSRMDGAREYLRVDERKLSGMRRLPGLHTYSISLDGLAIYPRLESLIRPALDFPGASRSDVRLTFGLPELESLLGGGLPHCSATIIIGSLGTGKTLLSLHYLLEGTRKGERGLYVGFQETEAELCAKAAAFGLDLRSAVASGQIFLITHAPVELEPDQVANAIHAAVETHRPVRVAIDSFAELDRVCRREDRNHDFAAALTTYLKTQEITTLYTHELPKFLGTELDLSETPFTMMAENVILLRQVIYDNHVYRALSILKMRASHYDHHIREFTIRDDVGITVLEPVQSAEGVLTGLARVLVPRTPAVED